MHNAGTASAECSRQDVARFIEWLAMELAPTLLGSKPATVLTFRDSTHQAALAVWRQCGCAIFRNALLRCLTLRCSANRETVLFYRPDVLQQCIAADEHRHFLEGLGYPVSQGADACLALLCERFSRSCPHEVGVLLGIPLKDVLGFMDRSSLPLTCRKEWCVYGDPAISLAAMGKFAGDKVFVSCLLAEGTNPYDILCGDHGLLGNIA